eukprot:284819348_4
MARRILHMRFRMMYETRVAILFTCFPNDFFSLFRDYRFNIGGHVPKPAEIVSDKMNYVKSMKAAIKAPYYFCNLDTESGPLPHDKISDKEISRYYIPNLREFSSCPMITFVACESENILSFRCHFCPCYLIPDDDTCWSIACLCHRGLCKRCFRRKKSSSCHQNRSRINERPSCKTEQLSATAASSQPPASYIHQVRCPPPVPGLYTLNLFLAFVSICLFSLLIDKQRVCLNLLSQRNRTRQSIVRNNRLTKEMLPRSLRLRRGQLANLHIKQVQCLAFAIQGLLKLC